MENVESNELIDNCFYVKEQRWKTWNSFDKEGKNLVTSLTKEDCITATRFYLKGKQEGFEDVNGYESTVGGKL